MIPIAPIVVIGGYSIIVITTLRLSKEMTLNIEDRKIISLI